MDMEFTKNLSPDRLLDEDVDVCDCDEIGQLFAPCSLIAEEPVAWNRKYILHIAGTLESSPNVAAVLSDHTVEVYNLCNDRFAKLAHFSEHTDVISEITFSKENSNLIYTGSYDGSVKLWDIRLPAKSTMKFTDTTSENEDNMKQFGCFDISSNNRLVAAGTNLVGGDGFILFWDVRKCLLLGGYWESHTDDITQVKFHSTDPNKLMSGSTDGLINLYDLSESKEEDALVDTLNSESSIEKLRWLQIGNQDVISCLTHTADVQFWKLDDAQPYLHLHRNIIGKEMKKRTGDYVYVVDVHSGLANIFLLGGSNCEDGACFRALTVTNNAAVPFLGFEQNKQRIRSTFYNYHTGLLVSGGEKGIINAWHVPDLGSNATRPK